VLRLGTGTFLGKGTCPQILFRRNRSFIPIPKEQELHPYSEGTGASSLFRKKQGFSLFARNRASHHLLILGPYPRSSGDTYLARVPYGSGMAHSSRDTYPNS